MSRVLTQVAWSAQIRNDLPRAREHLRESVRMAAEIDDRPHQAVPILFSGFLAFQAGDLRRAVCLIGAAQGLDSTLVGHLDTDELADRDAILRQARGTLGDAAVERIFAEGRAMSAASALDEALRA